MLAVFKGSVEGDDVGVRHRGMVAHLTLDLKPVCCVGVSGFFLLKRISAHTLLIASTVCCTAQRAGTTLFLTCSGA